MSIRPSAPAAAANDWHANELSRAVRLALACAKEWGDGAALFALSLALAERAGWLEKGSCARWAALGAVERDRELKSGAVVAGLRERTAGALPLGESPARARALGAAASESLAALLSARAPIEALALAYEALSAAARGPARRREQGIYYTPPELAAQVVALALEHAAPLPARPRVFDCCAGAGVFLLAAARALAERGPGFAAAVSLCAGSDRDARALAVTRAGLALLAGSNASPTSLAALALEPLDALREDPASARAGIDLLVTNPPYGHASGARTRAFLARRFPALRGGEVDLYAAFILRALALVRPGGSAALLVPDTWMTNARSFRLREAVLEGAELRAVADLGKPFAAARDTRVQAVILTRRDRLHPNHLHPNDLARATFAARRDGEGALWPLAPVEEGELRQRCKRGWQPYRSAGERALGAAMEAASVRLDELCEVGYGLRTGNNPRHVARGAGPRGALALVGGEEIEPFRLRRAPKWLRDETPELRRLAEKQLGRPRVAIQRIRTNAKAPWARWLEAAPVPGELVCLDSLSTLAVRDADADLLWALVGLFSSVALNRYHRLQTTDVNVKPSALRALPAPRALLEPGPRARLARLSEARSLESDLIVSHSLERAVDRAVYALYALSEAQIDEAERGFWGERFASERARLDDVPALARDG